MQALHSLSLSCLMIIYALDTTVLPVKRWPIVQANNAYIFPAIGFAAILTRASHISDDAFLVAAKCLSEMTQKKGEQPSLWPPAKSYWQDL